MYHSTPDSDPEKVKTALWSLVKNALWRPLSTPKIEICENVFVTNRPMASDLTCFAVVGINGAITDYDGYSRCICLVQLFAKDLDTNGTENMSKLTDMYEALLTSLPYNTAPYTFSKKNQVGTRDVHGFHSTLLNLDCLIY